MADPIVVIGAGGFGREAIDVIEAVNCAAERPVWDLLGVVDDGPRPVNLVRLKGRGVRYLGPVDWLADMPGIAVLVGVGSPTDRADIVQRIDGWQLSYPGLVHPTAVVGSQCSIAQGAIVCAQVSVGTNVAIGSHVHLNPGVVIGHDTVLHDFVSANPSSTVSGDCVLEERVLIGAGAVVLDKLRVGRHAVVGGSACVVRDVVPGAIVKGVPAR